MNDGDPDTMWGLPAPCGSSITISFQFELRVSESLDPLFADKEDYLKVEIFALADGEAGCWSSNACGSDQPASFTTAIDESGGSSDDDILNFNTGIIGPNVINAGTNSASDIE